MTQQDTQPPAETLATAKARAAKRAASGDVHIEGSIYEGMAACLTRHGVTIAHVVKYEDAVEIAAALKGTSRTDTTQLLGGALVERALKTARDFIMSADNTSGYCMCGSPVEGHGIGDGHSPVDDGSYRALQVVECIDEALATPKPPAGGDAGAVGPCDFYLGDCMRCGKRADRDNQGEPCRRRAIAALALPAPVVEGASLERALLVFAACARDLGPDVPDDEWAKFRLLASDYRRAHAAYVSLTGTEPPFPEDAHAALSEGRSHG